MNDALLAPGVEAAQGAPRRTSALSAADRLSLAASPAFALMAIATGPLGGARMAAVICTGAPDSPLAGMAPMYLLMALFHLVPWLRLIGERRRSALR